jgi:guanine deaminase
MSYQSSFMQQAIALAREGKDTDGGGAFGAVIVRSGQVIAACHNLVGGAQDPTQHAELRCIQLACKALGTKDLSDCDLYTSCVPCMMCLGAARWARFQHIYYGASAAMAKDAGFIYSDMFYARDIEARDQEFNMQQFLGEEAAAVWND